MSSALLMELHILLGVKTPEDIKMKEMQYLICFPSLCEETQPISAVVGVSFLQVSRLFWGDGSRVWRVARERCSSELCWGGSITLGYVAHPEWARSFLSCHLSCGQDAYLLTSLSWKCWLFVVPLFLAVTVDITLSVGGIVEVLPNLLGRARPVWWLLKVGGANPFGSHGNESSEMVWLLWLMVWRRKVAANAVVRMEKVSVEQGDPEIHISLCSKLLCKTGTKLKRSLLLPFILTHFSLHWELRPMLQTY